MGQTHTRAHIRLNTQGEVLEFLKLIGKQDGNFSIENKKGDLRVNAASMLGLLYAVSEFNDETYLAMDGNGEIPNCFDIYRV